MKFFMKSDKVSCKSLKQNIKVITFKTKKRKSDKISFEIKKN